ncbi:MAG: glycosyltransferase [Verrucomicrobia bacterium]|nr:glycosyltransferase [Cytophagales bacterium]
MSIKIPLVSVICLCYNQARFVEEALQSVLKQTYPNIELIVADDASQDGSKEVIENFLKNHTNVLFFSNGYNQGNCKTFNEMFAHANGKYIIDLAADDILLNNRIEAQVNAFEALNESFGVIYTDCLHISEDKKTLGKQYATSYKPPSGDVYAAVLANYFIAAPTMMIRKTVLDTLQGYDENLSYEDFDFWVRSARKWQYFYLDEVLTLKRKVKNSLSAQGYTLHTQQIHDSTFNVCQKAFSLNKNETENKALALRIKREMRQCLLTENFDTIIRYADLLKKLEIPGFFTKLIIGLAQRKLRLGNMYQLYREIRRF